METSKILSCDPGRTQWTMWMMTCAWWPMTWRPRSDMRRGAGAPWTWFPASSDIMGHYQWSIFHKIYFIFYSELMIVTPPTNICATWVYPESTLSVYYYTIISTYDIYPSMWKNERIFIYISKLIISTFYSFYEYIEIIIFTEIPLSFNPWAIYCYFNKRE